METMPCTRCDAQGKKLREAFTSSYDGTHYPAKWEACYACDGKGAFPAPDVARILKTIAGRKGLCSKAPERGTLDGKRAYYVWRLARFHGGADVTLPMTAEIVCGADPYRAQLEQIAEGVARRVFGSDMAAAARWAPLLSGRTVSTQGLPVTAQSGGPVLLDAEKPDFEAGELG